MTLVTFEILDKKLSLTDLLFTAEGRKVTVVERDGNTVQYKEPGRAQDLGEVGKDLFMLGQLKSYAAYIMALRSCAVLQGTRYSDIPIGIKTKGFGLICVFNGKLSYRFFKQGGRVPNFAPVSDQEAQGLISGTHQLKYIKGSSEYRISPK